KEEGRTGSKRDSYRADRSVILLLYAAKIAAAELYAPEHERLAIISALRAEQRAALRVLRERHLFDAAAKRKVKLTWRFALRETTRARTKSRSTRRPRVDRHRHPTFDGQHR